MSLKSVMFAGYNKFDDAKVRIGSWREELALKELTGVTRLAEYKNKAVFNATGPRVLYHTDRSEAKDAGKSTSEVSFVDPATVAAKKDRSAYSRPGPRAVRSEQELRAVVKAEEAASASLKAEESKKGDFDTTFRQSFKRYSGEEARAAKPQSLKPGYDTPSSSSPSSSQRIPRALMHDAHVGKDNASEGGGVSHYTSGTTVTLWSEGGMAAKGGTAPQTSFGRTSIFTEPGVHPSFFQEVYSDPAPHHISLPEGLSDLEASTLMFLKRRVAERGQQKPLPSVRGLWRLLWARTYEDAVGQIGPREFREAMAAFQVPVTQCELWAVITAFGRNGVGQISLDKLIHFMRADGLSESRRDLVRAAFRRLDCADSGVLRLKDIREACDLSRLPAVTKGKASKEEATAIFLDHLHNNDGIRSDTDESLVSLERFQEAFLDIGTACTQHLPHSTESPPCPEAARDGRESEALFSSIASSLTG